MADRVDQRQKLLRLTDAGNTLWAELPDPISVIHAVAFAGMDDADLARTSAMLETATRHLHEHLKEE